MVSEQRVTMSVEAEILLKKYFVASRRARNIVGVTAQGTQFPQSAMNILWVDYAIISYHWFC